MKVASKIIIGVTAMLSAACDMIEYHPYEVRLDESEKRLNHKSFEAITSSLANRDTISFILTGDTQRSYDQIDLFVASANNIQHDFVVVAGDVSDFGLQWEFELVNERLQKLHKPYVAVIGNHDFSGNGRRVFEEMYGPVNDVLQIRDIKLIFLNTNSRETGFNGQVPDLDFLSAELNREDYSQAILVSHIPPFDADFDPELETGYHQLLSNDARVKLSLHAHQHRFFAEHYYDDHVNYMITTAVQERGYFVFKVWRNDYSYEKIIY